MILASCVLSMALAAQPPRPERAERVEGQPPAQTTQATRPERAERVEGSDAALPYSIAEVRRGLASASPPPADVVRLAETPVFRANVEGQRRPIDTILDDLARLPWEPIPNTSPTHTDMMAMVTPVQAQPYGAFGSATEVAQVIATSYAFAAAVHGVTKLVSKIQDSRARARVNAVHAEVDAELAELERNNNAADEAAKKTTTPAPVPIRK